MSQTKQRRTALIFGIFKVAATALILIFLIGVNLSVNLSEASAAQPPQNPANGAEVLLNKIQRVVGRMVDDLNKPAKNWQSSLTGFIKNFLPSAGSGYGYIVNDAEACSSCGKTNNTSNGSAGLVANPASPAAGWASGTGGASPVERLRLYGASKANHPPILWNYSGIDFKNLLQSGKNALALVNQDFGILAYAGTSAGNERGFVPDSDSEVLFPSIPSVFEKTAAITKQVAAAAKQGVASLAAFLSDDSAPLITSSPSLTVPASRSRADNQTANNQSPRFTRPAITTDKEVINQVLRSSKSVLAPFTQDFLEPRERVVFPPAGGPPTGGQPLVSQNLKDLIKELARKITDIDISKLFSPKELGDIQQELTELQKKEVIDESTLDTLTERISERLPKTPQTTSPSVSSGQTPQTGQTIRETRVVEKETKIVETQVITNETKINELTTLLDQLKKQQVKDRQDLFNAIALTNRINTIPSNTTINNVTITNPSFANEAITDAMVIDTITASNYLPLGGGTVTGNLTVDGAVTFGTISSIANVLGNFGIGGDLSVSGGDINLGTGSATTTLTSSSGNLGIATTTPSQLLSVQGNALISGTTTVGAFLSTSSIFSVLPSGNVGIGTTRPGGKLEVVGDIISKGTLWTARTAAAANSWFSVTYGNGLFVAVALDGTNRVMTSPDGITWTARNATEANQWYSVTYGNGLFVAVAYDGTNRVMTSPDGITWTARAAAEANQWQSVTYANGLFVAVADSGTNRVMTSPDGITWTARTAAEANSWRGVTYGNGLFVAVAITGTNRVMTSPDGITWTARAAAVVTTWRGVTYGNGLFVAVSSSGTDLMTSPDGITWTARTVEASSLREVTYGNGLFVAVSYSGTNQVITSGKSELNVIPTNNIYQGGTTFYGNVGIGTTTSTGTTTLNRLLNIAGNSGPQLLLTEPGAGVNLKHWYASTTLGSLTLGTLSDSLSTLTEYFRINSSGLLGLGTTTPSQLLSVQGGALIAGTTTVADLVATGTLSIQGAGTSTLQNNLRVLGTLQIGSGSTYISSNELNSSGNFTIKTQSQDNHLVLQTLGRVGIASTTPWGVFSVERNGANSTMPIFVVAEQGTSSPYFIVNDLGNVGIGTTTPRSLFAVQGNALISGNLNVANLTATGTLNLSGLSTFTNATSSLLTVTGSTYLATASGNVGIGTTTPSQLLSVQGNALISGTTTVGAFLSTSSIFSVLPNGNVGIGTAAPAAALHIYNATQPQLILDTSGNDTELGFYAVGIKRSAIYYDRTDLALRIKSGGDVDNVTFENAGNVGIGTTTPGALLAVQGRIITEEDLYTGNLTATGTALLATKEGSVGIGTSSPSQLLSVHGNGLFSGNLNVANLTATGTLNLSGLSTFVNATASQLTVTGNTYLATNSGSVGIGTTTPSQLLSVQGGALISGTTTVQGLIATNTLMVGGNSGTSFVVKSDGSVGIGTAAPSGLLHITETGGGNEITKPQLIIDNTAGSGGDAGAITFSRVGIERFSIKYDSTDAALDITSGAFNGTNLIRILNTGFLGIGTTTPGALLSVHGNALFSGNLNVANLTATGTLTLSGSTLFDFKNVGTSTLAQVSNAFSVATSTTARPILSLDGKDGNVGIGTASSTQRLTVAGSIENILPSNASQYRINPKLIGSVAGGGGQGGDQGIYVAGRYAYVANYVDNVFRIYDISTSSPALVSSVSSSLARAVYVSGQYAYVSRWNNNIEIYDITVPARPSLAGVVNPNTGLGKAPLYVSGRYLYIADYEATDSAFRIFDVSNPALPVPKGVVRTNAYPQTIQVVGNRAFVLNNNGGITVVNVANPSAPIVIGSVSDAGNQGLSVQENYAYSVDNGTLYIHNVSSSTPSLVSTIGIDGVGQSVFAAGRYVYIVNNNVATLQVFDVSNPKSPVLVGRATTSSDPRSVFVSGRYAYVPTDASTSNTLQVFDISGIETTSAIVHSLEAGNLQVRANIVAKGALSVEGGANIGAGGIYSAGPLAVSATTSLSSILGGLTIGTTTPATSSPNFIAITSSVVTIEATSTGAIPLTIRGAGTQAVNYFQIQNSANLNQLVLSSTGNLGIGTTTPGALLAVQGRIITEEDLYTGNLTATGTALLATKEGSVGISTTTPSQLLSVQGNILTSATTTTGGLIATGTVMVQGNKFVVDGGSGNVGIGTAPTTKSLEVSSHLGVGGHIYGTGSNVLLSWSLRASDGTVTAPSITFGNDIDTGMYSGGADILRLVTAGADRVTIDASGLLGISTTTPSQLLSVQGNALISGTTTLAHLIATGTSYVYGATGQADFKVYNGSICADNNGGAKCQTDLTAGTVYGDTGTFTASDLAENYPISDESIEEGDIVALSNIVSFTQQAEKARFEAGSQTKDKNKEDNQALAELLKTALIKATPETQNKIIGAISTNPGVLLGDTTGMTINTKTKPVALSGRIPVKVNLEGGAIITGDPITISSVPGIGKKAAQSGKIVGYALENYNGPTPENNGKVLVFTSLGYWIGSDIQTTNDQQLTTNDSNLVVLIIDTVKDWLKNLKVFIEDGLVRLKNLIAERITTDELELKDKITGEIYCVSIVSGQLTQVLGSCNTVSTPPTAPSADTGTTTPPVVSDVEPPVITLNGFNPIEIEIGISWVDPGATVTDNANDNLGVYYKVDGVETGNGGRDLPQIDTSIAGTHIITYTSTDQAGNIASATRTVNVIEPVIPTITPDIPDETASTTPTQ